MRGKVATRKVRAGAAAVVFGLAVLTAGGHASAYVSAGGGSCHGTSGTSSTITYGYFGAENSSTDFGSIVWCPLNLGANSSWSASYSGVVMNHRDTSSADEFYCAVYQAYDDGTWVYSSTKYTCSTGGGCSDSTTAFTGRSYLSWQSSDLAYIASILATHETDTNYGIVCVVPKSVSGSASYIHSYFGW